MAKKIGEYSIGIKYEVDQKSIQDLQKSLDTIQHNVQLSEIGGNLSKDLQDAGRIASEVSDIISLSFNKDLGTINVTKFTQLMKQANITVEDMAIKFASAGNAGATAFSKMSTMIMNTKMQITQSNKLLSSMYDTFTKTIKWGIASSAMNTISGAVQKAYGYVQDLDKSLNNIRIVTGKSAEDMDAFAVKANQAAKALGQTTTAYTEASLIYYQQGLGDTEAQARADVTLKAANVTGQSASEVSEQLTAVWNGYKVSADEAELYIDRLAAVAANSASNLEELSVGMSKVASAANAMGVGEEQLAAQISTIISTTRQAPESVGTALKTIYARMSDIKMGSDDAEITLGNYTAKMAQMGVNVLDANGQLREMGDVIEEIGGKWQTMSKEQQVALAQTMAGTRQYNNLIALFENWDQYTEMLGIASDAQGTLQKQEDIYMESTAAHLKKLKATWEDLYAAIFKTDEINTLIDLGTNLVQVFDNFFDSFGGGIKSIVAFGSIVANVFSKQITKEIIKAKEAQQDFQNNKDIADLKNSFAEEILKQKPAQSAEGIGAQTEAQTAVKYYKEIASIQNVISEEQYNSLTNMQAELSVLAGEKAELEVINQQTENKNLIENDLIEKIKSEAVGFEEIEDDLVGQCESLENVKTLLNEINQFNNERAMYEEQTTINKEQELNAQIESLGLEEQLTNLLKEQVTGNQDNTKEIENTVKALINKNTKQKEYLQNAQKIYNIEREEKILQKSFSNVKSQALDTSKTVNGIKMATSAMSSFSSSVMAANSLIQIWNNENATFGEKMLQTLMSMGMLIPSIISSFKNLNEAYTSIFSGKVAILAETQIIAAKKAEEAENTALIASNEAVIALRERELAFAKLADAQKEKELVQKELEHELLVREIAARTMLAQIKNGEYTLSQGREGMKAINLKIEELQNQLLEKEILLRKAANDAAAADTNLTNANNIASGANAAAKEAQADATAAATAAQEGLNAAMESNPIGIIIAVLAALVVAIVAVVKAQKKWRESLISAGQDTKQEAEKIRELVTAYQELQETYDDSVDAKQKLGDAAVELAKELDNEELRVMALAGRWDEYNEKLKEVQEEQSKINLGTYRDAVEATSKELEQAAFWQGGWRDAITTFLIPFGFFKEEIDKGVSLIDNMKTNIVFEDMWNDKVAENTSDFANFNQEQSGEHFKVSSDGSGASKVQVKVNTAENTYQSYKEGMEAYEQAVAEGWSDTSTWKDVKNTLDQIEDEAKAYEESVTNLINEELNQSIGNLEDQEKIPKTLQDYANLREEEFSKLRENEAYAAFDDEKLYELIDESFAKRNSEFSDFAQQFAVKQGNRIADEELVLQAMQYTDYEKSEIMQSEGQLTEKAQSNLNQISNELSSRGLDGMLSSMSLTSKDWERILNPNGAFDAVQTVNTLIAEHMDEVKINFIQNNAKDAASYAADIFSKIQTGEITNQDELTSDDNWSKLQEHLEAIKNIYPELADEVNILNDEWAVGTQEYYDALNKIQNAMSELAIKGAKSQVGESAKELKELFEDTQELVADNEGHTHYETKVALGIEDEEFKDKLDDLLNAQYEVVVNVHTDAEEEFSNLTNAMDAASDAASKIGENYIVAADDIRELGNAYPGILENAQYLADGTLKLDREMVASSMAAAQAKVKVDTEETLEKLNNDKTELMAEKAKYEVLLQYLDTYIESEGNDEQAQANFKAQLQKIENENNAEATNTELTNDQKQAESSKEAGSIVSTNWSKAYEKAAKANAIYTKQALANNKAIANNGTAQDNSSNIAGISYQGSSMTNSYTAEEADIVDASTIDSMDNAKTGRDSLANFINAIDAQINDIDSLMTAAQAKSVEFASDTSNRASGKGSGSGGGSNKDPDFIDYLEDERDRYHDINIQIKECENEMDKLSAQQKKLMGKGLAENLMKQTEQLQKQVLLNKEKLKIQQQEAAELKTSLTAGGATFDEDGNISNYGDILASKLDYVNHLTEQYNQMSASEQENYKAVVEAAQKDYETFKENIDRYDELISEEMPELQQKVQDLTDQKISLQIEAFEIEINAKLNLAEAQRTWNKFVQDVITGDDSALGDITRDKEDLLTYYNPAGEGIVESDTKRVNDLMGQLAEYQSTGTSSVYGDNINQLMEDLKTANDQLMKDMTSFEDLVKAVEKDYLNAIEDVSKTFDTLNKDFEYTSSLIQHDMKTIQLLYGEDYEAMGKYYDKQTENYNQQLDSQSTMVEYWKDLMDKEEVGSEAWKKYKEEWEGAVSTLNSTVESSIQNLLDKYQNSVKGMINDMNKGLTGGKGLNYAKDEWDLINKQSKLYLDNIEGAYETTKLQSKYQKAINDTSNLTAQKKLNDLMNEEISMLKEKDKLSQYDIDRANAKYDLALKQIALEEAQQNKSQMRLKRDSQGNYTYQYAADNDAIANAEDEYNNALNSLYKIDKDEYNNNLNSIFSYYQEWQDKIAEAANIKDEEERQRAYDLYNNYYGGIINGLVEQNETAKQNLFESTELSLQDYYMQDVEAFTAMSDAEKMAWMGEEGLIPGMISSVQDMVTQFADPEYGFPYISETLMGDIRQATADYQTDLATLEAAAKTNFANMKTGIDANITSMGTLITKDIEQLGKMQDQLDKAKLIKDEVDALVIAYGKAKDAGIAAATAANKAWQDQTGDVNNLTSAINAMITSINNMVSTLTEGWKQVQSSYAAAQESISSSSSSNGASNSSGISNSGNTGKQKVNITMSNYSGGDYNWSVVLPDGNKAYVSTKKGSRDEAIKKFKDGYGSKYPNVEFFDTGGYTGDWNSNDGKAAILHEKELVLNKSDTSNILNAVSIIRGLSSLLNESILSRISNIVDSFNQPSYELMNEYNRLHNEMTPVASQEIIINADFPNATNSKEIEEAFNALTNKASQYINSKRL